MTAKLYSLSLLAAAACASDAEPPPVPTPDAPPQLDLAGPGTAVAAPPALAPEQAFASPVAAPAAISSTFGPRWKASDDRNDFHLGIDYFAARGTPLLAIGRGRVYATYPEGSDAYPNGGNVVVIEHPIPPRTFHGQVVDAIYATYLHTDSMLVEADDQVVAGQTVATMGSSGDTEFVHLHFETRVGTPCSLAYQQAHPEAACARGFDPHVHPFLFVGGANRDQIAIAEIPSASGFVVRYTATRGDLDLDVIASDLGTLGFGARAGIDATSVPKLDDFDYGWLRLAPAEFLSTSEHLVIDLRFAERPAWLELRDIYGRGVHYGPPP